MSHTARPSANVTLSDKTALCQIKNKTNRAGKNLNISAIVYLIEMGEAESSFES